MNINYVLTIDPGKATGVAVGRYSITMPMEVIFTGIIPGGTQGFCEWLYNTRDVKTIMESDCSYNFPDDYDELDFDLDVVCENFALRGGDFAPDLEPLRIEGVVIDHFGSIVNWHSPADKSLVGDKFLKRHDLWQTGADVGHSDARDSNDALLHLFAHAMKIRHLPSLEAYWRD